MLTRRVAQEDSKASLYYSLTKTFFTKKPQSFIFLTIIYLKIKFSLFSINQTNHFFLFCSCSLSSFLQVINDILFFTYPLTHLMVKINLLTITLKACLVFLSLLKTICNNKKTFSQFINKIIILLCNIVKNLFHKYGKTEINIYFYLAVSYQNSVSIL